MDDREESEYRLVYNWGQTATEMCEVWRMGDQPPHSYVPLWGVGTHDDDSEYDTDTEVLYGPADRLRRRLTAMLEACDKPILRFPQDFTE